MTKKKKAGLIIAAIALVAVVAIGGTLAYFTSQDSKQNVFTLGNVKGSLTEESKNDTFDPNTQQPVKPGKPNDDGSFSYGDVLPGDKFSKIPTVTLNADSADAYVRVKLEVTGDSLLTDTQKTELISATCLNFGTDWNVSTDGYVYYNTKLSNDAGGQKAAAPVFTIVTIPTTWGNSVANASFGINITADLIQADNFTPVLTDGHISGWGTVAIENNN